VALLFAVAIVAVIVVAIALGASTTKTVHDMQVVFHDVQRDVNALNQLVSGNTS
jgi:hypothetical protein